MSTTAINEKLVQYFNESLAMENAAVEWNRLRIEETPILLAKQQLQYHLEETYEQQNRLKKIISDLGGSPTEAKASLPMLLPGTVSKPAVADARAASAEKEIVQSKQDAIIENAEIVTYKMLMLIAEETGHKELVPELNKSLQEEVSMSNFIMGNAPMMLRTLLPHAVQIGSSQEDLKRVASA